MLRSYKKLKSGFIIKATKIDENVIKLQITSRHTPLLLKTLENYKDIFQSALFCLSAVDFHMIVKCI